MSNDWDDVPCGLVSLDAQDRVVAANARFLERTGYALGDIAGRVFWTDLLAVGSRVSYYTQLAPLLELDGTLEEIMVDLRTASGGRLPTLLNATRVRRSRSAEVRIQIALMSVPDRREYEDALRRARDEADQARVDAEQAQAADARARRRLELLSRASTALATSADVDVAIRRLAAVLVDGLADWCLVYATDPADPTVLNRAAAHADPARTPLVEDLVALLPEHATPGSALRRALEHGEPVLVPDVSPQHQRDAADSDEVLARAAVLEPGSAVVVPATARAARVATLMLVRRPDRAPFTDDDLTGLTDLAARVGVAIDNLRRRAREHSNSVALQQALLTAPPVTPGLQIVTRYLPAMDGNEIGGDWHDAFVQPDGTPVLVIGDVVGHDIHAAASMGQLRGVLRTLGYTRSGSPAEILGQADAAARGLAVDVLASAVVARVERTGPRSAVLRWSNAGHPPPLLLTPDGPRLLETAPDRLLGLGVGLERARTDHSLPLRAGDTLLLYTDGLVERRGELIDTGLSRLLDTVRDAASLDLDAVCDLALAEHPGGTRDDIALLAVRLVDPAARP